MYFCSKKIGCSSRGHPSEPWLGQVRSLQAAWLGWCAQLCPDMYVCMYVCMYVIMISIDLYQDDPVYLYILYEYMYGK